MKRLQNWDYIRMMRNSYDRQMVENFREQVKKIFCAVCGKTS